MQSSHRNSIKFIVLLSAFFSSIGNHCQSEEYMEKRESGTYKFRESILQIDLRIIEIRLTEKREEEDLHRLQFWMDFKEGPYLMDLEARLGC